jgi:hypothetical protein
MNKNDLNQIGDEQPAVRVEDEFAGDNSETAMFKATADYYERRWHGKFKDHQRDFWVAVGLYLVLSSVAFVVF